MKNLIQTGLVAIFVGSAAHAQQGTYFSKVDFNSISNLKHQGCGYSCCPGFTAGSSYPLGEQVYVGVPFAHGLPDSYAFTSQNSCTRPGEAFQVAVNFPGDGSIHMLLSSWSGCAGGPAFLLKANLSDGTARTWRLENQVDYRDHNGICTLSGSRCQQVWTNGGAQHLDLLSVPVEAPGKTVVSVRLESEDPLNTTAPLVYGLTLSSSADCNADGIIDHGQCRDGTLPDYNGNNVPDCCESGEACVVGNYPVQWRIEDGGNGHWYRRVNPNSNLTWTQAETLCELIGAHLATVPAASESAFVHLIVGQSEVYLGGLQPPNSCEPNCEWQWLTGEPWSYTNWNPGEPNNSNTEQNFLRTYPNGSWDDVQDGYAFPFAIAAEWDADCNNDGVVDYGQILQGQLVDANTNGIPDICEGPTCNDIDLNLNGIVDGGDLGILLAFWGPVSPAFPRADINKDGFVNGADLGLLLSFWGACPN